MSRCGSKVQKQYQKERETDRSERVLQIEEWTQMPDGKTYGRKIKNQMRKGKEFQCMNKQTYEPMTCLKQEKKDKTTQTAIQMHIIIRLQRKMYKPNRHNRYLYLNLYANLWCLCHKMSKLNSVSRQKLEFFPLNNNTIL